MKLFRNSCLFLVAVAVAGCAGQSGDELETMADATRSASSTPAPSEDSEVSGAVPEQMLAEMVTEAASRTGVDANEIEVVVAESVTWSDGSLGCPEPGMMYTQALVPGYRVVVDAGGEELNFHAAQSGEFRFCEDPQPPSERNPNE